MSHTKRLDELVSKVAFDFTDGRTPMSHEFLVENEVTADECLDLMMRVGNILDGYLKTPLQLRLLIQVTGVLDEESGITPEQVWASGIQNWLQTELLGTIGGTNPQDPV